MTTPNTVEQKTNRSVPMTERVVEDAFDIATKHRASERRNVSQSAVLGRWLQAGHDIEFAKTREEALALAGSLFDSSPERRKGV